jgi:hypothetical protein
MLLSSVSKGQVYMVSSQTSGGISVGGASGKRVSEDGGRVGDSSDGIRVLGGCSVSSRADGFSDEGSLTDETSLDSLAIDGCSEDSNSPERAVELDSFSDKIPVLLGRISVDGA